MNKSPVSDVMDDIVDIRWRDEWM